MFTLNRYIDEKISNSGNVYIYYTFGEFPIKLIFKLSKMDIYYDIKRRSIISNKYHCLLEIELEIDSKHKITMFKQLSTMKDIDDLTEILLSDDIIYEGDNTKFLLKITDNTSLHISFSDEANVIVLNIKDTSIISEGKLTLTSNLDENRLGYTVLFINSYKFEDCLYENEGTVSKHFYNKDEFDITNNIESSCKKIVMEKETSL